MAVPCSSHGPYKSYLVACQEVPCGRSGVAIEHSTDGQSAQVRTGRRDSSDLRQWVGILPDADLNTDGILRLGAVGTESIGPMRPIDRI
jgi:hypothetical protein